MACQLEDLGVLPGSALVKKISHLSSPWCLKYPVPGGYLPADGGASQVARCVAGGPSGGGLASTGAGRPPRGYIQPDNPIATHPY
jgi:hypothetical protein